MIQSLRTHFLTPFRWPGTMSRFVLQLWEDAGRNKKHPTFQFEPSGPCPFLSHSVNCMLFLSRAKKNLYAMDTNPEGETFFPWLNFHAGTMRMLRSTAWGE